MEKRPVLIASATLDEYTYGPVAGILEENGFPVVIYNTDRVLGGQDSLRLNVGEDAELAVSYNGVSISPGNIGAAWYRKLGMYDQSMYQDRAKQLYVNSEIAYMHEAIWTLYPDDRWLNAPGRIREADRRLGQLLVAKQVGFSIPHTVISSSWDYIASELITDNSSKIAAKTIRGVISDQDRLKAMYTSLLDNESIEQLQSDVSPFPAMYQPFIDKHREWRITVVGEDVFPAAIYTKDDAKVDWRTKQTTSAVEFKKETLPSEIEDKCIQYLGKLGLKYGAFDLIEKQDGEMIFLECNPNGQYKWIEDALSLPISASIAAELIKISISK